MTKRKPNGYWTHERLQAEALKHEVQQDFRLANPAAFQAAYKKGILSACRPTLVTFQFI